MSCLAEDTIQGFVEGRLTPELAASVDEHVDSCPSCRQLVAHALRASEPSVASATTLAAGTEPQSPNAKRLAAESKIGRYRIRRELGAGGMGVVYAAYDPELDRDVALKVLRPELAARADDGAARLQREGRVIAKLAHPNVVTVFDVGTDGGTVYVAMELVDGGSVDAWLHEKPRGWREVLAVFLQAGEGLAAAHAKGLVHRDFKPANVLIGSDGRARVTDFGLARSAPQQSGEALRRDSNLELTRTGSLVGTPAYMPPEQFDALPTDARSDQFSFAVSVFEGLYGVRPFAGKTIAQIYEAITRGEIASPKTAVPPWLRAALLPALAAKPEDRYPTLAPLLAALRRDPPARRRRIAIAVSALVLAGGAGALVFSARSRSTAACSGSERALATIWDKSVRAKVDEAFAATKMAYAPDAFRGAARQLDDYASSWTTMKTDACMATQMHEQTEAHQGLRNICLDERLLELRAVTTLFEHADVEVVRNASRAVAALTPVAVCADLRSLTARVPAPTDLGTATQVAAARKAIAAARALGAAGKYKAAYDAATAILPIATTLGYRPLQGEALLAAGTLADRAGNAKAAQEHLTQAVQAAGAGRDDRTVALAWIALVRVQATSLARYDDALTSAGYATATIERIGGDDALAADLSVHRGFAFEQLGKYEDARAAYQQGLDLRKREVPPNNLEVASTVMHLAAAYRKLGKLKEAKAEAERVMPIFETLLGPNHPETASALHNVGALYVDFLDDNAAIPLFQRALAIRQATLEPDHPEIAKSLTALGVVYRRQRKFTEAIDVLNRAIKIDEGRFGKDSEQIISPLYNLGTVYLFAKQPAEAEVRIVRAMDLMIKAKGPEHPNLGVMYGALAQVQGALGRDDESFATMRKAIALDEKVLGPAHRNVAFDYEQLGSLYFKRSKYNEALAEYQRALAIEEKVYGKDGDALAITLSNIGGSLTMLKRYAEARPVLERALPIAEKLHGKNDVSLMLLLNSLGEVYRRLGRSDEALAMLERSVGLPDAEKQDRNYYSAQIELAWALAGAKRDLPRARKLVESARAGYAKLNEPDGVTNADAWLKAH